MTSGLWLDEVDSTLDEAHRQAVAGAGDGTWIAARVQHAGRGSRGRTWHSPPGGLWLSVVRRSTGQVEGIELLSLRAGLACAAVLDGLPAVAPVQLKWPNDLIVHGRKAGGLLTEARWQGDRLQWVAIGLGLNVSNEIPLDLTERATALGMYCQETSVEALAGPLAAALGGVDLSSPRLSDRELAEFDLRDALRGRPVRSPVPGTADGIAADGRLLVRDAAGVRHPVAVGEHARD